MRWLKRSPPELSEVRYSLEQMTHDAKRATDVIRQIRAMAKRRDRDSEAIDLGVVVQQSIDLMRRDLQGQQIDVSASLPTSDMRVSGDRVQIQQVVINLLMNAVQAMAGVKDRERKLAVSVLRNDDEARVIVADSGHGINEADAAMLFTPFFTTKAEGMGMGLSICRSIVEAHGGRIWAESREDSGASMQFTLPIRTEAIDG